MAPVFVATGEAHQKAIAGPFLGGENLTTFFKVHRYWFFEVDLFAGFESSHSVFEMGVGVGSDQNEVD